MSAKNRKRQKRASGCIVVELAHVGDPLQAFLSLFTDNIEERDAAASCVAVCPSSLRRTHIRKPA